MPLASASSLSSKRSHPSAPSFWRRQNLLSSPAPARSSPLLLHRVLLAFALAFFALLSPTRAPAQTRSQESALSDAEVEQLRDTAYDPPARVLAFLQFLDDRAREIDRLLAGRRQPGRETDIHDQIEQISSILNDLEDNLDDYSKRHRDIRKALPKLLSAAERWGTTLRAPPGDPAYNVSRDLALEALADLRTQATAMGSEQKEYFRLHPPSKEPNGRPQ